MTYSGWGKPGVDSRKGKYMSTGIRCGGWARREKKLKSRGVPERKVHRVGLLGDDGGWGFELEKLGGFCGHNLRVLAETEVRTKRSHGKAPGVGGARIAWKQEDRFWGGRGREMFR